MLMGKAEMETLRAVAFFKDCPAAKKTHGRKILHDLLTYGYLRYNKSKTSLRVSNSGYSLLEKAGINFTKDAHPVSDKRIIARRHASAEIALHLLSLQIEVCTERPPAEIREPIYFSSQGMRKQFAANVLGMSKFSGILFTSDTAFVAYNIDASSRGFYPSADEGLFRREIIRRNKNVKIIFFCKGNYEQLVQRITEKPVKQKHYGHNYSSAFSEFNFPVCLVPFSDSGVNQMRIILTPNYRETFSRFMLGLNYQSVATEWVDALKADTKECFIVLFDFDLKRLDRAFGLSKKLHILVFEEQSDALLYYLKGRQAEIYDISTTEAMRILNLSHLPNWSAEPYITSKGGSVNVEAPKFSKTIKSKRQG